MKLPPVLLAHLIQSLETLSLSQDEQIRLWSGQTEVMDSYIETMCYLIDDSGFHIAVEKKQAARFLGKELTAMLLNINVLAQQIDAYAPDEEIAAHPAMGEIRGSAPAALILVKEKAKKLIYKDSHYWQRSP